MPVPSSITELSTTAANNSPSGSESPTTTDNYLRALAAFVAQQRAAFGGAADPDIPPGFPTFAEIVEQATNSGTTAGTSTAYTLAPDSAISAYAANMSFWVIFHTASGASPTLAISGLSSPPTLVRQGSDGAYVAIAAGEIPAGHASRVTLLSATQALVESLPPAAAAVDVLNATRIDVASAGTVDLTASAPNTLHINITGTTTITGFTVAAGRCYFVRFDGALTLTDGAGLVTQRGTNIATRAGDTCILRATAANAVEVLCYTRAQSLGHPSAQTASGTATDFTGIPSWVRRVTVMFADISTNGTSDVLIRLGTTGGVETSSYRGAVGRIGNIATSFSDGFALSTVNAAGHSLSGSMTLNRLSDSAHAWVAALSIGEAGGEAYMGGGSKSLSGALDRVRLTTSNGTDTFDAGTINILYEG